MLEIRECLKTVLKIIPFPYLFVWIWLLYSTRLLLRFNCTTILDRHVVNPVHSISRFFLIENFRERLDLSIEEGSLQRGLLDFLFFSAAA